MGESHLLHGRFKPWLCTQWSCTSLRKTKALLIMCSESLFCLFQISKISIFGQTWPNMLTVWTGVLDSSIMLHVAPHFTRVDILIKLSPTSFFQQMFVPNLTFTRVCFLLLTCVFCHWSWIQIFPNHSLHIASAQSWDQDWMIQVFRCIPIFYDHWASFPFGHVW